MSMLVMMMSIIGLRKWQGSCSLRGKPFFEAKVGATSLPLLPHHHPYHHHRRRRRRRCRQRPPGKAELGRRRTISQHHEFSSLSEAHNCPPLPVCLRCRWLRSP